MKIINFFLMIIFPAAAANVFSQPPPSYRVHVADDTREKIETASCMKYYGKKIDSIFAFSYQSPNSNPGNATVNCEPHLRVTDIPIYHRLSCEIDNRLWLCEPRHQEFSIVTKNVVLDVWPRTASPEAAVLVMKYLAYQAKYNGKKIMWDRSAQQCIVDIDKKSKDIYIIDQGELLIRVESKNCNKKSCRNKILSIWKISAPVQ